MNQMKELEIQLQSWAPRRPSPRVEQRIFGRVSRAETRERIGIQIGSWLRWIAPATAAFILLGVLLTQHEGGNRGSSANGGALFAVVSNTAYTPANVKSNQAGQAAEGFQFTNGSGPTSP